MNASTLATKKTGKPETSWLEKYQGFKEKHVSHASLGAINDIAMERFKSMGFPLPKDEMFTFVNLGKLAATGFDFRYGDEDKVVCALDIGKNIVEDCERSVITLVNGMYDPALSDTSKVEGLIKISPLAHSLNNPAIESYFKEIANNENDPFASLSMAFLAGGLMIEIEPNAKPDSPLLILNYSTGHKSNLVMTTPQVAIRGGKYSECEVIIKNVTVGGDHFINASYDFLVEERGAINLVLVEEKTEGDIWRFSKTRIAMRKESRFTATQSSHGSTLGRSHYEACLQQNGARFSLNSVAVLSGSDQSHSYVRVHHEAPDCRSDQLFKNVIKEKGRLSVDTTVIAHRGASGADSGQLIKNLLLTDNGRADVKPNLMIYTDDVQCAHGATTSELGEEELIYLRTRGLDEKSAKALLTEGFIASALTGVKNLAIAKDIKKSLLKTNGEGQCRA
ncbi:Iron-sulfur cluster assembly protein SufD [hydrothermal vent metagenome]|uniref:Iron-sulfur cluster assembly protein SufD n=1 Tax=hydrothermal vent metagenome TaxID=652676 RepID=A0A3B1CRT2_9ZZZZ